MRRIECGITPSEAEKGAFDFTASSTDQERITTANPKEALEEIGSRRWVYGIWYLVGAGFGAAIGVDGVARVANGLARVANGEIFYGGIECLVASGVIINAFYGWQKREDMLKGLRNFTLTKMGEGFAEKIASN